MTFLTYEDNVYVDEDDLKGRLIDLCQPTERFPKSTTDGDNPRIRSLGDAKVNKYQQKRSNK